VGQAGHHDRRRATGGASRRTWRYVQRDAQGNEYAFTGTFLEITPCEKVRNTFEYERLPGVVFTETVVFEDVEGGTRITVTSLFASKDDLDALLDADTEAAANDSWDRLARLFAS
jgi:uncharacterized protein YndB with AHSA1/START domain